MIRVLSVLLWTAVFLLLLLGIDQLLVRVPASHPAHVAVAGFYRDLRGRVLGLAADSKPAPPPAPAPAKAGPAEKAKPSAPSIEAIIDRHQAKSAAPAKAAAPVKPSPAPPAVPAKKPAAVAQPSSPAAGPSTPEAAKPAVPAPFPGEPKPRYSYVDEQGKQFFADTLAEVPEQYRGKVKVLGR